MPSWERHNCTAKTTIRSNYIILEIKMKCFFNKMQPQSGILYAEQAAVQRMLLL